MNFRDELRDPLGWALAGIAGVAAWLVLGGGAGSLPAAVLVAMVVLGVKVVVGTASRSSVQRSRGSRSLPAPSGDSEAAYWLARADRALAALRSLSESPSNESLDEQIQAVDDEAEEIVAAMRGIAGRVAVIDTSVAAVDPAWLRSEETRLDHERARHSDPMVLDELGKASAAVREQLDSYDRLMRTRQALVARLQSTAVGLEGLVTRLAEVITLAPEASGDKGAGALRDLTRDLDGMRLGLSEVAAMTRGGYQTPWPGPDVPAAPPLPEDGRDQPEGKTR